MKKNVLIIIPYDEPGRLYTREMRCQEKIEILGTMKPPLTPALACSLFTEHSIPFTVIENMPPSAAASELIKRSFKPDLIIAPTCTPTVSRDMRFLAELSSELKKTYGAAPQTAAFGPHTSGVPDLTLEQYPALDFSIAGEPEQTLLDLASADKHPADIPGIAWRAPDGIRVNEKRDGIADLDALPFPDWSQFSLEQYRMPLYGGRFLTVETSRGCPHSCSFCVVPLTHGGRFREKSTTRIIDEIFHVKEKYGVSFIYIWGDTAVLKRRSMEQLCNAMIDSNTSVSWISNTRPEVVQDFDFASLLAKSGCKMLSIGVESGSASILDAMGKKNDPSILRRSVDSLRRARIQSFMFFIFGYPGETLDTMRETLDLALELDPDYVNFYPAVPYPGTPLWHYCNQNAILPQTDWEHIDFTDFVINLNGLPKEAVMNMVRRAKMRFYFRPAFIARSLRDLARPGRMLEMLKAAPAYLGI